jgi:hypothetical protein
MSGDNFIDIQTALKAIENKHIVKLYKEFSSLYSPLVASRYLKLHHDHNLQPLKDSELSFRVNLKCTDKCIYTGQVDDKNRRSGLGFQLAPDKSLFIGYFKNSLKKGPGRLYALNGIVYDGKWSDSLLKSPAKIFYLDGQIYNGNVNSNVPQGIGTLELPGKWKYNGGFLEGLKHGKGVLEKFHSFVYKGDFLRDKIEGKGSFKMANDDTYEGEVKKGKMHGKGVKITKDYTYRGEFLDGLENGQGEIKYSSNRRYTGFFRNGRPDGKGVEQRPDDLTIEGLWKAGTLVECYNDAYEDPLDAYPAFNKKELAANYEELHDKVQASRAAKVKNLLDTQNSSSEGEDIITESLPVFDPFPETLSEGDLLQELQILSEIVILHSLYKKSVEVFNTLPKFEYLDNTSEKELKNCKNEALVYRKKNVKFRNEWTSTGKNGGVYKGEKDLRGAMYGRGLLLSNGSIFQGFFQKGVREGHGREILPNGSYYEGGWSGDMRNGWGVERIKDKEYAGEWTNGVKDGLGFMKTASWAYEGQWKNDLKEGQGIIWFDDGSKYSGELANDAPHGYGCFVEVNKKATVGVWENGKLVQGGKEKDKNELEQTLPSRSYSIPLEITPKSILTSFPDTSMAPNEYSFPDFNILQDIQD